MMGGKVKTAQDYIIIWSPEEVLNVLHSTVGGQVAQEQATRSTRHLSSFYSEIYLLSHLTYEYVYKVFDSTHRS